MKSVFVELGKGSKKETRTVYTSCIDLEKGEYFCRACKNDLLCDQITELSAEKVYNMGVKTRTPQKEKIK